MISENEPIDPYAFLALRTGATEEEIQEAFQIRLGEAPEGSLERERAIIAYGMIRHLSGRNRFLFDEIHSFLVDPFESEEGGRIDREALARELAFLSPWEAGDDTCLN